MFTSDDLRVALAESQRVGFLGSRPIDDVIAHAQGFVLALQRIEGRRVVDLGSGGGVPGLVIAHARPDLHVTMIDRRTKRTDFLARIVRRHELSDRCVVVADDVDDVLRPPETPFDAAVARGFAPPYETLGIGVAAVRPGGLIVVSEPPEGDRWIPERVEEAGAEGPVAVDNVAVFRRCR